MGCHHVIHGRSSEKAVESLEVEEFSWQSVNEDEVDEIKDASDEVTHHGNQNQRFATKIVRKTSSYQGVENRRARSDPLNGKLDVIDLPLDWISKS